MHGAGVRQDGVRDPVPLEQRTDRTVVRVECVDCANEGLQVPGADQWYLSHQSPSEARPLLAASAPCVSALLAESVARRAPLVRILCLWNPGDSSTTAASWTCSIATTTPDVIPAVGC